jgi:serine/threonine protein kinase
MAPERVYGEIKPDNDSQTCKVDMWSVGVLIHVLVFGRVPFEGETYSELVKTIKKGKLKEMKKKPAGGLGSLLNLMDNLLKADIDERFAAVDALNHEFFKFASIELANMELKRKQLNNMHIMWCKLMLKDSIKDFACFVSSYDFVKQTFEQVFEKKLPTNNKQIINGFSWVTEDFTLARFIFNRAFSKAFKNCDQNDPNLPE